MKILALDSSAKPASVAVVTDGKLIGQYFQNSGLTHSRTLLAMTEALLKNLELKIADLDLIAVSKGPGSFTGVRIGVSAAKGMAWGADIPVCGISTLEAMAYQIQEPEILLCPVMDARRNQVYNALFKWQNGTLIRLCEDRAISLEDLATELNSAPNLAPSARELSAQPTEGVSFPASPASDLPTQLTEGVSFLAPSARELSAQPTEGVPTILLIGDGAELTYNYLTESGIACTLAPELLRYQTAFGVALAAINAEQIPATDLEPSYLRPSQAERERANTTETPL